MNKKIAEITGMIIPEISFGKKEFLRHEGGNTAVLSLKQVKEMDSYQITLEQAGFEKREEHCFGTARFVTYVKNGDMVLLSFYPSIGQIRLVAEPESLEYQDKRREDCTTSLFTQIDLEDFGLSDVIRLSDGRFIILDGGYDFDVDEEKLFRCLKEQSPFETPVIALWIMTHPHNDHYPVFFGFWERYGKEVEIQGFLYNFPDGVEDLLEVVPADEVEGLNRFHNLVQSLKIPYYRAHTGQVYQVSNARIEVLSSPDDTFFDEVIDHNIMSLILKVNIEGQTLLLPGDGYFDFSRLPERYGTYLKSDILQVPHHGFYGGTAEGYRLIDPDVVIVPVSEHNFYYMTDIYRPYNQALVYDNHVKELRTGTKEPCTLELPYSYKENGKKMLFDKIEQSRREMGATSWVFTDMTLEDCVFETINMTAHSTEISVFLYFEDRSQYVSHIKYHAQDRRVTKTDFSKEEDLDGDALYYNPDSLAKKGIPQGARFAVHFSSKVPVIITGKKVPTYHY
ncbi:MAG: hypothetical protein E7399_03715 [Ruminococcaceae bacterium]|nr:hypothetical protein [Oscillospiraceae bacterium]